MNEEIIKDIRSFVRSIKRKSEPLNALERALDVSDYDKLVKGLNMHGLVLLCYNGKYLLCESRRGFSYIQQYQGEDYVHLRSKPLVFDPTKNGKLSYEEVHDFLIPTQEFYNGKAVVIKRFEYS